MALEKSKWIPTAFWVGFLALGFVTSVGGPSKRRVIGQAAAPTARTAATPMVAQTEPQILGVGEKPAKD